MVKSDLDHKDDVSVWLLLLLGFYEVSQVVLDLNRPETWETLQLLLGFRSERVGPDLELAQLGPILPLNACNRNYASSLRLSSSMMLQHF